MWKIQAVLAFVLIVGAVMFYAYGATPIYESEAKILLLPRTSRELVITAGTEEGSYIRPVTEFDLNTEVELLESDNVISDTIRAIDERGLGLQLEERGFYDKVAGTVTGFFRGVLSFLNLTAEPMTPFERDTTLLKRLLSIEPAFESNVLIVSLKGEDPDNTTRVLDKLLGVYMKRHNDVFSLDTGDFYDHQVETYQNRLTEAEDQLREFYKNFNVVDLERQNMANIALMSELSKELHLIDIQYDQQNKRIELLEEAFASDDPEILVTAEMREIPAIVALEEAIVPLIIRRTEVVKRFALTSREYQEVILQIQTLRDELRIEIGRAVQTDKLELATLGIKSSSLKGKIGELKAQATEFNQLKTKIGELQRQAEIQNENYRIYNTKTEDSRMHMEKKNRNLANISIVDHPSLPIRPVSPKKTPASPRLLTARFHIGRLPPLRTGVLGSETQDCRRRGKPAGRDSHKQLPRGENLAPGELSKRGDT